MNRYIRFIILLLTIAISMGCSSKKGSEPDESDLPPKSDTETVNIPDNYPIPPSPTIDGVKYVWERAGIGIETYSTTNLNLYDERSHNLMICLYQISDLKFFDNLINQISADDATAMQQILSCKKLDESIISTQRIFISPKQHKAQYIDREKDVRHIALVAGYNNNLSIENVILRDIPIKYGRSGIIFKDDEYSVAPLNMRLFIGSSKMQDLRDGESFKVYEKKEQLKSHFSDPNIDENYDADLSQD